MGVVFDNGYRKVHGTVSIEGPVTINEPITITESIPDILQISNGNAIFQAFNTALNEASLNPYVLRRGATINIHWEPIKDAAEYIVTFHKIINNKVYFMAEYHVERNKCFLATSDLIDNGFVVQVAAENREGKILAKSRGILDRGNPRNW